jgi:hypothetical protein
MDQSGDRTRRAKYLDWCSARLAERFLDLSPEQIYELARPNDPAARSPEADLGNSRLPLPTHESYRSLVQRVTDVLLERTPLPTYEQWSAAYDEAPERFDVELLGFWKEAVEGPEASPPADANGAGGS